MNIPVESLIEVTIALVCGLALVGFTMLRIALNGMQKQHENTQQLIEEKFMWAEQQRKEASSHWEQHFSAIESSEREIVNRISYLESRVTTIEVQLSVQPEFLTRE